VSFPVLMPLSTVAPAIAHRIGYRRTVVTGMLLVAAGMALLAGGYLSVGPGSSSSPWGLVSR
jgi:fucose permease